LTFFHVLDVKNSVHAHQNLQKTVKIGIANSSERREEEGRRDKR